MDPLAEVTGTLRQAGCVAAEEEARELLHAAGFAVPAVGHLGSDRAAAAASEPVAAAGSGTAGGPGGPGHARLAAMVARRCTGEPLAWIVGTAPFCGLRVAVHPHVYVPRPQTEAMARWAVRCLPPGGTAVDLCTGSGAVALVLARRRPQATVLATEVDPLAVACARANGLVVLPGDLDAPLPVGAAGTVDVVTAVVPYVPTPALHLLPRDVLAHEPRLALDGGPDGCAVLRRAVAAGARLLRPGGWLVLELGGDQSGVVAPDLRAAGFGRPTVLRDEDGDDRAVAARRLGPRP